MRWSIAFFTKSSSTRLSRPKVESVIFSRMVCTAVISRRIHISRPSMRKMWKPSAGERKVCG